MAYVKHNFKSNDVLYASQLNDIDNAIFELHNIVEELSYKEIEIVSFSVTPNQVEIGSSVEPVLNYSLNKEPSTLTLDETSISYDTEGVITITPSLTSNKTWTLVATDEKSSSSTKTATLSFLNKIYYGVSTEDATINNNFLLNLSGKDLASNKNKTLTVNAGAAQYVYIAVPSRFGACSFTVGGFTGGFAKINTFNHTNGSGYSENYDVYRSDNAALGNITINMA